MIALFSDIFTAQANVLVRMDARGKLAIAMAILALVLLTQALFLPLLVAAACLGAALLLRLPVRLLLLRMLPPILLAGMVLLIKGAFGQGVVVYRLGPLSLHSDGLTAGLTIAARVTGATAVVMLLSATTPAHRLFASLRWMGVPATWVEVAMLMYRYIFVLIEQATEVAVAQKTRLGYSTKARTLRCVGALGGIVCLRSIDQAHRIAQAMQIRCYRGAMPFSPMPRLRRAEAALVVVIWLACAAALLAERWLA